MQSVRDVRIRPGDKAQVEIEDDDTGGVDGQHSRPGGQQRAPESRRRSCNEAADTRAGDESQQVPEGGFEDVVQSSTAGENGKAHQPRRDVDDLAGAPSPRAKKQAGEADEGRLQGDGYVGEGDAQMSTDGGEGRQQRHRHQGARCHPVGRQPAWRGAATLVSQVPSSEIRRASVDGSSGRETTQSTKP